MKLNATIFWGILATTFIGCESNSEIIDIVRNAPLNESYTFSQAFENSSGCTDSEWFAEKDESNRDVAVHTCTIKIENEKIVDFVNSRAVSLSVASQQSEIDKLKRELSNLKDKISVVRKVRENANVQSTPWADDTTAMEVLTNRYKVNSIEEAEKLSIKYSEALEHDIAVLPGVIEQYKKFEITKRPSSFKVKRTTKVIIAPNNNLQWIVPSFSSDSPEFNFSANQLSIPVMDIERKKYKEGNNIYTYIIDETLPLKHNSFQEYIANQCLESKCPLEAFSIFGDLGL